MQRRRFSWGILASLLTAQLPISKASVLVQPEAPAPFTLPNLPYPTAALEPYIDATTMSIHHDRHHQAYIYNLNNALATTPVTFTSLENLLGQASRLNAQTRNNAGGHWNHSLFWSMLAPAGAGGQPSTILAAAISRDFGSLANMRETVKKAALSRFGSGWVWLTVNDRRQLTIGTTPNQDNPLMDTAEAGIRGMPIMGLDLWEHAYYLKYQNKRADYIDACWSVLNWNTINDRYNLAVKG